MERKNYKLFLEMSKDERFAARTGKKTTVTATAETRRSTTCVCIDWGGFLITCFSRSQTALGLSSPEAEYYGICSAGSELIYVMGVIRFFGFELDGWISVGFLRGTFCVAATRRGSPTSQLRHVICGSRIMCSVVLSKLERSLAA